MAQSKELPGSGTIKRTARERYNLKDYNTMAQSKGLPGSATIKISATKWHNKKDCKGVAQSYGKAHCLHDRTDKTLYHLHYFKS